MTKEDTAPIGMCGSVIALLCSWSVNHSIGWGVAHFMCGWFYVIYYLIEYAKL